ncbi:MAG: prepilin-type N-terminal cleavage/methylation domain-containing protein [Halioglobus sp.]
METDVPRDGEQGFTLVEVMVALTLLALVLMGTVTALRTLGNTQSAIESLTDRVDEVRSVSVFLRDLLESAVVGQDSDFTLGGGSTEASYFRSGADFLEFESIILFGERYGGSYLVRIAKEEGQMVLRWQDSPGNDKSTLQWNDTPSRVIVEQLEELTVATREEYAEDWSDRRSVDELKAPAAVKLRIKAAGRYWPDLVLQVRR